MSQDFLENAYKEHMHWVSEVKKTDAFKKMKLIEQVISSYGGVIPTNDYPKKDSSPAPAIMATKLNKRQKITALCLQYMLDRDYSSLQQLTAHVNAGGVEIESNALSWYLSQADNLFVPNRSLGWSLTQEARESAGDVTSPAAQ